MLDAVAASAESGECSPFLDVLAFDLGDPCLAFDALDKVREVVMSKKLPAAPKVLLLHF